MDQFGKREKTQITDRIDLTVRWARFVGITGRVGAIDVRSVPAIDRPTDRSIERVDSHDVRPRISNTIDAIGAIGCCIHS
jgi:hypothetical protein